MMDDDDDDGGDDDDDDADDEDEDAADDVGACAVEIHMDMSQEAFREEIYSTGNWPNTDETTSIN